MSSMFLDAWYPLEPSKDTRSSLNWKHIESENFSDDELEISSDIENDTEDFFDELTWKVSEMLKGVDILKPIRGENARKFNHGSALIYYEIEITEIVAHTERHAVILVDYVTIRPCAMGMGLFDKFIYSLVKSITDSKLSYGIVLYNIDYYLENYSAKYPHIWQSGTDTTGHFPIKYSLCPHKILKKNVKWFQERSERKALPTYESLNAEVMIRYENLCESVYEYYANVINTKLKISDLMKRRKSYSNEEDFHNLIRDLQQIVDQCQVDWTFQDFVNNLQHCLDITREYQKICVPLDDLLVLSKFEFVNRNYEIDHDKIQNIQRIISEIPRF